MWRRVKKISITCGVIFLGLVIVWFARPIKCGKVPEELFGPKLVAQMQGIQCMTDAYFDRRDEYIKFSANQDVIENIAHIRGLVLSDAVPQVNHSAQPWNVEGGQHFDAPVNAPEWWVPVTKGGELILFDGNFTGRNFHVYEREMLYYQPSSKLAWYHYSGLD